MFGKTIFPPSLQKIWIVNERSNEILPESNNIKTNTSNY